MSKFRIGIDVGGTFTHAVAISSEDYSLIGHTKVLTTHSHKEGVAKGVIDSLINLLNEYNIDPVDIVFIAHSTTQATNALLEGDVSDVGVIATGKGMDGIRTKKQTDLQNIDLRNGKKIKVFYSYIDETDFNEENLKQNLLKLREAGAKAIVCVEAFSVDNPDKELIMKKISEEIGLPTIATHEISGLYGLKLRTITAVINASLMPKMIETAIATEKAVKSLGINIPLMIMRSDGGVMSIDEMKRRPILTILSGPAAGIASALLYVKISDGIFIEVGGTSTDITVIKNGKAAVKSAQVGGHRLFLRTLDCRTVGIAGGSLPKIINGKVVDVGPRSAHILGLKYSCFANENDDPNKVAVTVTCAANFLDLVKPSDWAYGNKKMAEKFLKRYGSPEVVSNSILKIASQKVITVIKQLIKEYKLDKLHQVLIGGGGGAAALVPFIANEMNLPYKIAENHSVISAIGVALAMVTDTVEKTCLNPSEKDIVSIINSAKESVIKMGAEKSTVEVKVEFDKQKNILKATAFGTIEFKSKDLNVKLPSTEEKKEIIASSLKLKPNEVEQVFQNELYSIWKSEIFTKTFFGIFKQKQTVLKVMDKEGIIRLSVANCDILFSKLLDIYKNVEMIYYKYTKYGDAGAKLPKIYVVCSKGIIDLSGVINLNQMFSLLKYELEGLNLEEQVSILVER